MTQPTPSAAKPAAGEHSHEEQIQIIERLIEQGAQGDDAALRKAVTLWELCTREHASPAERQRIDAMLVACGVPPAREYPL